MIRRIPVWLADPFQNEAENTDGARAQDEI
jgi:hypothetical protein